MTSQPHQERTGEVTDREKNIAIAEWMGVKYHKPTEQEIASGSYYQYEPDYCNDLDAMHEVESKLIKYTAIETFLRHLKNRVAPHNDWEELIAVWCLTHATASQRAEALLKTIGKWKE